MEIYSTVCEKLLITTSVFKEFSEGNLNEIFK
jgi:hypothetical protein